MTLQKKDFIEIEFSAKTQEGELFDSNREGDLKKLHAGHKHKIETKPFVFSLGQGMFLKGVEDFLIGKELGSYNIKLTPENAFGPRRSDLVQMMPIKVFAQQKVNPVPGAMFNFDGRIGKVLTSSGGRVMIDFNNPLSGKNVEYDVKVLRKVEDINEKAKAFIDFLFKRDLKFNIEGKKIVVDVEKQMAKFLEMFKDKFKEILDLELEVKEVQEKAPEKPKEEKKE